MRRITKVRRSVRAVSPVIATLLMIAITVIAAIVVYAWVTGYIGGKTTKTGNQIELQSYTSGGNLILYVQNTGQGIVHLKQDSSVYVNDDLKNILNVDNVAVPAGGLIPITVGQTVKVEVNYQNFHSGDRIKVVTIEGTTITHTGYNNGNGNGGGSGGQTCQVTFTNGLGGATIIPSAGIHTYAKGSSVQISTTPSSGYLFSGWTYTGSITFDSASSASTNAHINSDGTITAIFVQIQTGQTYQVNFVLGTGGSSMTPAAGSQNTYPAGSSVPINALANTGYLFSSWTSTGTITFDSATSASTNAHIGSVGIITANFAQIQTGQTYQVTFNLGAGGDSMTPTPGTQSYAAGSSVAVTTIPLIGYQFSGWTSAGTITFDAVTSTSTNAHINSDGTITANFVQTQSGQTYQVTFVLGSGGSSIIPTAGSHSYAAGSSIEVNATPSSTYQFSGWTSTGTITFDSVSSYSTNAHIGSDGTITANFAKIQTGQNYQVNFVMGTGGASITPTAGSHTYAAGSSVVITATAASGYQFSGWSSTGTITFDSTTTSSTNAHIDSNGQITASFTQTTTPPSGTVFSTNFDGTPWDQGWSAGNNPPFYAAAGEGYGSTVAAKSDPYNTYIQGRGDVPNWGNFTSNEVNTNIAGGTTITITFQYKVSQTDLASDLRVAYSTVHNPDLGGHSSDFHYIDNIGRPASDNVWYTASYTILKSNTPSAFTSSFSFRFDSNLHTGAGGVVEQVWIDNILIVVS